MPTIRFLQDFQGVETNGVFYERGQVADVPDGVASRCVADKRAERVSEPKQVVEVEKVETVDVRTYTDDPEVKQEIETVVTSPVIVDEPAPVMTSSNQSTPKNKRGR